MAFFWRDRRLVIWQKATHCIAFFTDGQLRILKVDFPKVLHICEAVPGAIVHLKLGGKITDQAFAIISTRFALLLLLDNLPPNQPVRYNLRRVDGPGDGCSGRFENLPDSVVQRDLRYLLSIRVHPCNPWFHSNSNSCWPGFGGALGRFFEQTMVGSAALISGSLGLDTN